MNREMRRALRKREVESEKSKVPFLIDSSRAEKIIGKAQVEKQIIEANRIGRLQGLESMYSIIALACHRVPGIGRKRTQAIKEEIVKIICEIGKGYEHDGAELLGANQNGARYH